MFSNKYSNLGCISMIALILGIAISTSSVNTVQAHEQHKKVDLKIKGMGCDHCAKAVETIISKCSGIAGCAVSYKEGKAIIEVEPGEVTAEIELVVDELGEAGFEVPEWEIEETY